MINCIFWLCAGASFRDKSVANQLKAENITDYTVKWTEEGVDVKFKGKHVEF